MELEAATRADGTRACQIKAPVVRVYDEGLLKIVDGVVPDLCDDEWRRLGALWSSRRFIQAENTKRIEQTFLPGIGDEFAFEIRRESNPRGVNLQISYGLRP